jgi:hypothetical protein
MVAFWRLLCGAIQTLIPLFPRFSHINPLCIIPHGITPPSFYAMAELASRSSSLGSSSSDLNVGLIIACVAGAVLAVILLASIIVVATRRHRRRLQGPTDFSVEQGRRSLESSEFGEHKSYSRDPSSDGVSMSSHVDSKPLWMYAHSPPQQYRVYAPTFTSNTHYNPVRSDDGQGESQHYVEPLSISTPFMRESMSPQETRSRYLPPLVIPSSPLISASHYQPTNPVATDAEDSRPSTPTSIATCSSESMYSQPSASTHMHGLVSAFSPVTPPPLPLRVETEDLESRQNIQRLPTRVLGHLLKSRARRSSDGGPSRSGTQVSRIERSNSIISVPSDPTIDSIPSAPSRSRPLRQKSWKTPRVPMEPLMEAPDSAIAISFHNSSSASIPQPTTSHSQKPSLTTAFQTSESTSSHTSFATAPELSRSESESEFHAVDLYADTRPLKIASKAYRDRERAKLNLQTRLDGSAQDSELEGGPRLQRVHLRDQIVVRVPDPHYASRVSSAHATVEA